MTSHKILSKAYNTIQTLGDYVFILVPACELKKGNDPASFVELLSTCLVAKQQSTEEGPEPEFEFYEPQQTQSDVRSRLVWCDVTSHLTTRAAAYQTRAIQVAQVP